MKVFARIMAMLGIVYLVAVASVYGVLADRERHFQANGPTVQGTVVALVRAQGVDSLRGAFYPRDDQFPVIQYTLAGQTRLFTPNVSNSSTRYEIGREVTLVYDLGDPADPTDDLVAVKGEQMRLMELLPVAFLAAAGVTLWVLLTLTGVQLRKRFRENRARRNRADGAERQVA